MRLTILLATMLFLGGCGGFRRAKAPPPPGPTPARIPDQVANLEPAPASKNLPAPPPIGGAADAKLATANSLGLPETPAVGPPKPAKAKKPPPKAAAAVAPVVVSSTAPAPAGPRAPETPAFRLGELRTADEKERLRKETDQLIGQCAAALTTAEGRSLTAAQSEIMSRVRTFAQQARETMDKDPAEAKNLAAKGRTFAEALLAELK